MSFEDGRKPGRLRGDQPVVAATLGEDISGLIDQPDPETGGAPIDGGHRRHVAR
jgi:hypothetical protein